MSQTVSLHTLRDLAAAGALRDVELVGTSEGFVVQVTFGMERRVLETKLRRVRFFKNLDTARRFLRNDVGVSRFVVDTAEVP